MRKVGVQVATKRSKSAWVAPRSGGYSAKSTSSGKLVTTSKSKPAPPTGPASPSKSA